MRYTLKRDDIPLLSQWIKKTKSKDLVFFESGITVDRRERLSLQIAAQFAGAKCALAHSSVK